MNSQIKAAMLLGTLAAGGGFNPFLRGPLGHDELEGIDIEAEYELIQQKKSNLPASKRRDVVRRYQQNASGDSEPKQPKGTR